MNIELLDEYEAKFNEPMSIPFELPADKTLENFGKVLETCIQEKREFDPDEWGLQFKALFERSEVI